MTETIPAKSVDEYLSALPEKVHSMLEDLRKAIKAAAPKAEEIISYQIPTYKHKGPLVHFAAFKDHCSFVVVSKSILETFKRELLPYKISGRTIHFSPAKPIPATLVKKIVKMRVEENEARLNAKELAKPAAGKSRQ